MADSRQVGRTGRLAGRGFKSLLAGVVVALAATAGGVAFAQHGPGGHEGGFGGPGMFMGSSERMGRGIDHMLDGLNATDAQRAQIKQIAQAAAADLKAQHEASRGMHERAAAIFTAPTVDANAAETLRQQMLAQHDQASRRVLTAMLDISRVLSPDQRAKLAERMKMRHERMQERMHHSEHPKS